MSEPLTQLLRRTAEAVHGPRVDVGDLVARAEVRQRRRRLAVAAAAAAVAGAVVVGTVVARGSRPDDLAPAPSPPPAPSVEHGARPLAYAEGTTVHVGDRTVEARKPVAFIDVTDDGVVFEAALDGTLWFSDGVETAVIGTSPFAAAPTAHAGVVMTGDSGSLVVWPDASGGPDQAPDRFVVYDTSRRDVVAHIRFPSADDAWLLYVDEQQVYFTSQLLPGCWVFDVDTCDDPHLFRFDLPTGQTTRISLADWDAELRAHARMFAAVMPDHVSYIHPFHPGARLRQVGSHLVHADPAALTRTSGQEVRLRLPPAYRALGLAEGASGIAVSQWLDDDHVVVFADDGSGDLPAKQGDLLVCELPDGDCRVAVPRSSRPYVAPWRTSE